MFLFPVAFAKRLSERLFSPNQTGSDLTLDPGSMNGVLRSILSAEAPLVSSGRPALWIDGGSPGPQRCLTPSHQQMGIIS